MTIRTFIVYIVYRLAWRIYHPHHQLHHHLLQSMPPTSTTSANLATTSSWLSSFHATHRHLYHLLLLLSGHHHTFQNPVYGYFFPSPFCPPHQQGELHVEFHILHNNGLHLQDIYHDHGIHSQNVISLSVITRSN